MNRDEALREIAKLIEQMDRGQLLVFRALMLAKSTRRWVAVQGAILMDRMAQAIIIGEDRRKGHK